MKSRASPCGPVARLQGVTPLLAAIPYIADPTVRFAQFAGRPWAVLLDSGASGRYDIFSADPSAVVTTRDGVTQIERRGLRETSSGNPLSVLRRELEPLALANDGLPFCGGAMGYFGYDLARRFEALPERARDDLPLPQMAVGIYDWAVVSDHSKRRSWLAGAGRDPVTHQRWPALVEALRRPGASPQTGEGLQLTGPLRESLDRPAYADAFGRVKRYIREGDCYQINLALAFDGPVRGDPWQAYRRLRQASPAPFSAYLNTPGGRILCNSPERFLRLRGDRVETRPIKGTRPRGPDAHVDHAARLALSASEKDRAENLMIVDLLRNDIGRNCVPGSIHVPEMFAVESFANVHHLVSTVRGRLAAGRDALDLLQGCFPGGSITGAPKLRAMEIIEELEPQRRGVYCGAIGYVGFNGDMDTNIVIRTLLHTGGRVRFWAGGGIVADSGMASEYRECFDKAAVMLDLLGAGARH